MNFRCHFGFRGCDSSPTISRDVGPGPILSSCFFFYRVFLEILIGAHCWPAGGRDRSSATTNRRRRRRRRRKKEKKREEEEGAHSFCPPSQEEWGRRQQRTSVGQFCCFHFPSVGLWCGQRFVPSPSTKKNQGHYLVLFFCYRVFFFWCSPSISLLSFATRAPSSKGTPTTIDRHTAPSSLDECYRVLPSFSPVSPKIAG